MHASCSGYDEAGLGPLLGPLVLARCNWQGEVQPQPRSFKTADYLFSFPVSITEKYCALNCYSPLDNFLSELQLEHFDSKAFYRSRNDFAKLEELVLALLLVSKIKVRTVADLFSLCCRSSYKELLQLPWYAQVFEQTLKQESLAIENLVYLLDKHMGKLQLTWQFRLLSAAELNRKFSRGLNKAEVQAFELLKFFQEDEAQCLVIDRLGGRKYYREMLAQLPQFSLKSFEILMEEKHLSSYCLNSKHFHFYVKAERHCTAVGLASLLAKYLRELVMRAFNDYWRERYPQLPLTSGYYADACRWLASLPQNTVQDYQGSLLRTR